MYDVFMHAQEIIFPQLYSPVQNIVLWFGFWLQDEISSDELLDGVYEIFGKYHSVEWHPATSDMSNSTVQPDITIPDSLSNILHSDAHSWDFQIESGLQSRPLSTKGMPGLIDVLKMIQRVIPQEDSYDPMVSLVMAGPGDVSLLPQGEAAQAILKYGSGMRIRTSHPDISHVLVPHRHPEDYVIWEWFEVYGFFPEPSWIGVKHADAVLREQIFNAEQRIRQDYASAQFTVLDEAKKAFGHFAVGQLDDYSDHIGLPPGVHVSAEKLMARADVVSAIIDVTRDSNRGSALDPYILPLMKGIRTARVAAVDYALRELAREKY